jgi:hypothetical protein
MKRGGGKGKGKFLEELNPNKKSQQLAQAAPVEEVVYPGALLKNIYVMAPLRNT